MLNNEVIREVIIIFGYENTIEMETAAQASESKAAYYRSLTWQERLRIANYLNSIKYNYPENDPPRMDKTVFSMRSRK